MMTYKKSKKRKLRWGKIICLALLAMCIVRMGGKINQYRTLQDEATTYREQLTLAQETYQQKLDTIDLLSNDAYIERVARESLGMVNKGEKVVSTVKTIADNNIGE